MEPASPLILVAEDDSNLTFLIRLALRKATPDCEVFCVPEGKAALDRLRQYPRPSLLVTDLAMPGMNGLELIEHVKKEETLRTLPVVVYSSSVNPSDREQCERMRVDSFLPKKGSCHELCERIRILLSLRRMDAAC